MRASGLEGVLLPHGSTMYDRERHPQLGHLLAHIVEHAPQWRHHGHTLRRAQPSDDPRQLAELGGRLPLLLLRWRGVLQGGQLLAQHAAAAPHRTRGTMQRAASSLVTQIDRAARRSSCHPC